MPWDSKDPADVLDYDFTFTLEDGETIDEAEWSIDPSGALAVANSPADGIDGSRVYAFFEGGVAGVAYTVTLQITTSEGRVYNRKATLTVSDL